MPNTPLEISQLPSSPAQGTDVLPVARPPFGIGSNYGVTASSIASLATGGITISGTPIAGQILTATSSSTANWQSLGSVPAETSVAPISYDVLNSGRQSTFDCWGLTLVNRIPGAILTSFPTSSKITIQIAANFAETLGELNNCTLARTAKSSLTVIDHTPVTFGGSSSPTLGIGTFTSDAISLALDAFHDYWFLFFVPFVGGNDVFFTSQPNPFCEGGRSTTTGGTGPGGVGDFTTNTTFPPTLIAASGFTILTWLAA